ncbi:alpha/beta fold hydrolase [Streptomyces sp. NPDC006530]|uniref:alpha/beta fold hydrolase n=1 Tax=Streptomyces sp. NPDC006530 TaxID=3364750 RepID=UPI00369465C2
MPDPAPASVPIPAPAPRPTLVLVPSLGTTHDLWRPQLALLNAHFNVIRWDLPGHGDTPASVLPPDPRPTLETLATLLLERLEELRVDTFAYAGISLGGAVGAWLAAHHPERVESLALLCTSARFGPPEPWLERARTVRARGIGEVADSAPNRWFTPAFRPPPGLLADHHRVDPGAYATCCEILAGIDLRPDLARITAPTLVIAGRDDTATPPPHARELADGIGNAELLELPRAGHLANVERPEPVGQALRRHFAALRAPAGHPRSGPAREAAPEPARAPAHDPARAPAPEPGRPLAPDPLRRAGESARRAVLGDAHVDRAHARTTPFTARFQDFITRYAWGEIWGGSPSGTSASAPAGTDSPPAGHTTLDRRTRSAITLTALVAGGHKDELALHVQGALRNGLTPDDIADVLLQCAVYCSVPAANAAFAVAERAIEAYDGHADLVDRSDHAGRVDHTDRADQKGS